MKILYWLMGLDSPRSITGADSVFWYAASPVPTWALVLIALVGLLVAGVNLLPQNIMPKRTRFGLLVARVLGFGILLVLISQLEVRLNIHREVRPRIAVLTDTSGSMGLKDVNGSTRLEAARVFSASQLAALGEKADVAAIDFSWQLHTAGSNRRERSADVAASRSAHDTAIRQLRSR